MNHLHGALDTSPVGDTSSHSDSRQSILREVAERSCCRHLHLQGPPRSGRSSLLLDLACSVAASSPCRCDHQKNHSIACVCVGATIFMSSTEEDFPLLCHRHGQPVQTFRDDRLGNIQVLRVSSFKDCMEKLLTMHALPVCEQPSAILVDDMSAYFAEGERWSQQALLSATLVDTANWICLRRRQAHSDRVRKDTIFSVGTSLHNDSGGSSIRMVPHFFIPNSKLVSRSTVRICKQSGPPSGFQRREDGDVFVLNTWGIQYSDAKGSILPTTLPFIKYSVLQCFERESCIEWEIVGT